MKFFPPDSTELFYKFFNMKEVFDMSDYEKVLELQFLL